LATVLQLFIRLLGVVLGLAGLSLFGGTIWVMAGGTIEALASPALLSYAFVLSLSLMMGVGGIGLAIYGPKGREGSLVPRWALWSGGILMLIAIGGMLVARAVSPLRGGQFMGIVVLSVLALSWIQHARRKRSGV
jgi:hypothetical protein